MVVGSIKMKRLYAATDSTMAVVVSKAGDNLDQAFDASFEEFQATMDRLGVASIKT